MFKSVTSRAMYVPYYSLQYLPTSWVPYAEVARIEKPTDL
jgi:hypothetical protein